MHHVASLRTLLANNCTLSTTVDESLNRSAIDFSVDVQHSDITEKLGIIFHSLLIISLNHLLTDLFLNKFLGFNIVGISIS